MQKLVASGLGVWLLPSGRCLSHPLVGVNASFRGVRPYWSIILQRNFHFNSHIPVSHGRPCGAINDDYRAKKGFGATRTGGGNRQLGLCGRKQG